MNYWRFYYQYALWGVGKGMAMGEEQRKRFFKVVERVEVIEQVHSLAIESKES